MNLSISLRSEIAKTKRTAAFYFTLIGAAIIPFIFLVNALFNGFAGEENVPKDPLNKMFSMSMEMTGLLIFPLFVVLVCTLMPQIEYRNNTWKQVLSSPQTKLNIFVAKFLSVQSLMLLFLVSSHLFMWIAIIAIHFIEPGLHMFNRSLDGYTILVNNVNLYLCVLAVSAIQFWIGLRFKNFLIPVSIGFVLWITGMTMVFEYHSPYAVYFPYSFQTFTFFPKEKIQLGQVEWTSVGYAVFFLIAGFLDFRRRRMGE
jgi:hypothetical protein